MARQTDYFKDIVCETLQAGSIVAPDGGASLTGLAGINSGDAGGTSAVAGGAGATHTSGTGGAGGAASVTGGVGGAVTTGTGGAGGAASVTGGVGGAASGAAGTGGVGGAVSMTAGAGGAATDTGATAAGVGGAASLVSGAGGASSTTAVAGGAAGAVAITGGAGGAGAAAGTGGLGSSVTITAGAGGATSGAGTGGAAGSIVLQAAVGGTTSGGTAGVDGGVFLRSTTGRFFKQQTAPGAGGDQAEVLTPAQMFNGIFVHTISTGRTLTTPTGAQLSAACPAAVATGDSFDFTVITVGTGADDIVTLTAGDGNVTFVGVVTIGPNIAGTDTASATFRFRKTGASTWVGYRLT